MESKKSLALPCVVIAAGQGTRLRSVAASKPLAEVAGAPLIEHIIRRAAAGGAGRFVVVTGYEAQGVETFLAGLAERGDLMIETVRNAEWARPNGLSVLAAAPRLDGEFILLMSDHLFDPEILRRILEGRRQEAALTLGADFRVTRPDLDLDDATKLKLDQENRIVGIGKALEDYDAVDTGIFVAGPALLEALRECVEAGGSGSLSEGVQVLARAGTAFIYDIGDGWWLDVDDEPAFRRAERELPPVSA
jgi:choline kinase